MRRYTAKEAWCKLNLLQIQSRQKIDNAIFTFGTYESDGEKLFGYKVYCAGSGSHEIEKFMPLQNESLTEFINKFKQLKHQNYKGKIKIKSGWSNINLQFYGSKTDKGIKVKTYITGFLFFSSGFGSSYISQSDLDRLINNLEQCTVVQTAV
jgi:hypothetical protein